MNKRSIQTELISPHHTDQGSLAAASVTATTKKRENAAAILERALFPPTSVGPARPGLEARRPCCFHRQRLGLDHDNLYRPSRPFLGSGQMFASFSRDTSGGKLTVSEGTHSDTSILP